jgi:methylmalonyl-CoA epimerase
VSDLTPSLVRGAAGSIAVVTTTRGIHHVGFAVADLDDAVATYVRLFDARVEGREVIAGQGAEAVSLDVSGSRVELLAPTGEDTPVARFLSRRGPGMHHVAYEVDDVATALAELSEEGAELVDERPRPGLFGLEVAFLHPDAAHGVLTEVVSRGTS